MRIVVVVMRVQEAEQVLTRGYLRRVGHHGHRHASVFGACEDLRDEVVRSILHPLELRVRAHRARYVEHQRHLDIVNRLGGFRHCPERKRLDSDKVHQERVELSVNVDAHLAAGDDRERSDLADIHVIRRDGDPNLGEVVDHDGFRIDRLVEVGRGQHGAVGRVLKMRSLVLVEHHVDCDAPEHEHAEKDEQREDDERAILVTLKKPKPLLQSTTVILNKSRLGHGGPIYLFITRGHPALVASPRHRTVGAHGKTPWFLTF